ncbi:uncharacterized protein LOC141602017 [Silene latifolia]|uniref:uncharacterized protein LOC141602017 n=1 Tax=Silene latifolia TaxID=37657 RepID=UPI003D7817EB
MSEDTVLTIKGVEAGLGIDQFKGKDKSEVEPSKAQERILYEVDDLYVNVEEDVDYASDELRSLHESKDDEGCSNPTFNPNHDFSKPIKPRLGLTFPSVEVFRKALVKHSVENGYDFYCSHNGRDMVTTHYYNRCKCEWNKKRSKLGKCFCEIKNPCKYRVHARNLTEEIFEITGLHLKHNCVMSTYNRKVGSEYLAEKYIEFWRNNTDWKLEKFQKHVLQDLGIHVTYMRCWLARARAKLMIHGNGKDQYAKVWDYALAILKYNPGSSYFVACDNIERPPPIFKRFYVCLKACKDGFIAGYRPILEVDGCHLRGVYPGMCLVAVGIDGNNNIFPVARAVVEVENRDSWTWFCARHIWANLKLRFSGQLFKDTFWAASRALTRADFSKEMEDMKFLSRDAWAFLNDIPPRHWSRHAFDYSCKSNLLLNNVCEVFNAVLKDARDKPILTQLEWMRKYVM